ncbi:hypothetical protein SAMN06265795_10160 [Noviherbaspirillum humi]|uniref:Uncharacterized protein n=1 Tax=Noviherbaspirillum humi TaxID=1688639 RepID=A0A239BSD4_9BURK|nr:hypothetical protein SAMN06265795_10160 [Noviherbaspirillum humi]
MPLFWMKPHHIGLRKKAQNAPGSLQGSMEDFRLDCGRQPSIR